MKFTIVMFLAPILGLFMIYGGIHELTTANVTCGGSVMQQDQECVHYRSGSTSTNDYATEHRSTRTTGIMLLGFGVLAVVGGGAFIRVVINEHRKTRQRRAAAPPGSPPQ